MMRGCKVAGTAHEADHFFIFNGKYSSLKDEILSNLDNEIDDIKTWNDEVILKAEQFINTAKVKSMIYDEDSYYYNPEYWFKIENGETMSPQHLQSLILYTDFSQLSTSFTSTFRKQYDLETLDSVKQRNRNYYWMSRLLIESVQGFTPKGLNYKDIKDEVLYCGMSIVLNMPNADIYLRGPTSTTSQIIIAQNFSKNNGVILQLGGQRERRFNVSWLSKFAEESERIFVRGTRSMRLVSIRVNINQKWNNYEIFFKVLWLFDRVCNAENPSDSINFDYNKDYLKNTDKDAKMLSGLISKSELIPKYVQNCFDLFRNNLSRLEIKVRLLGCRLLNSYPKYIRQLILMTNVKTVECEKTIDWNSTGHHLENQLNKLSESHLWRKCILNQLSTDGDKTKLIKRLISNKQKLADESIFNENQNRIKMEFLELFPNLTNIYIHSGDFYTYNPFSIIKLCETIVGIQKRECIQVEIECAWSRHQKRGRSWLFESFIEICSSNTLIINGKESNKSFGKYFNKKDYDKGDWPEHDKNVYKSIMGIKGTEIGIAITELGNFRGHLSDILTLNC